jgi:hypothetical protein
MIGCMRLSGRAAVGAHARWTVTIAAGMLTIILSAEALQRTTGGAARPARFAAPRTPWDDPDLQGAWPSDHVVDVPFERLASFGTRNQLTDAEFAAPQARATSDVSPTPHRRRIGSSAARPHDWPEVVSG